MVEMKNTQGASATADRALAEGEVAVASSSLQDCDPSRDDEAPEPLLDPTMVEEAKAMIALDCSCDRDCEFNQEGICTCRITAIAVMLKGAQSYVVQSESGKAEELNVILGKLAPGMEAEGRDAPAARGEARQPDGEAGAPHPDSATPSGDGGERATRGEIEGLVGRLVNAARDYGEAREQGDDEVIAIARGYVDLARTTLLSRITSPSSGGGLRAYSTTLDLDRLSVLVTNDADGERLARVITDARQFYEVLPRIVSAPTGGICLDAPRDDEAQPRLEAAERAYREAFDRYAYPHLTALRHSVAMRAALSAAATNPQE